MILAPPNTSIENNASLQTVVDRNGTPLHFYITGTLQELESITCYAYPGFLIEPTEQSTRPSGKLEVVKPGANANLGKNFSVPPSPAHVSNIASSTQGFAYVPIPEHPRDTYLARLADSAWVKIQAGLAEPGSRLTLDFERSGSVVFNSDIRESSITMALMVKDAEDRTMLNPRFKKVRGHTIPGWLPGTYTALVETFGLGQEHPLSDSATFEVRAGEITTVELDSLLANESTKGFLRGTLHFQSWELVAPWYDNKTGFTLEIEPLSEDARSRFHEVRRRKRTLMTPWMQNIATIDSGNPAWMWDAGAYPPGRYRAHINPLRAMVDFEVLASEFTILDAPIPMLAVTLLDIGIPIEDLGKLRPLLPYPESVENPSLLIKSPKLIHSNIPGQPMMICPPGGYDMAFLWNGKPYDQRVNLKPGWNTVEFKVRDIATAIIALSDQVGNDYFLDKAEWEYIRVLNSAGRECSLTPMHYRINGNTGYPRARLEISSGAQYSIEIGGELNLSVAPSAFTLDREEVRFLKIDLGG